jgi:hypothetical protein
LLHSIKDWILSLFFGAPPIQEPYSTVAKVQMVKAVLPSAETTGSTSMSLLTVAKIGAPNYCTLAMDNPGNLYRAAGLRNCKTWADDVLADAKKEYLAHEHCPTCFR